eukprot:12422106-Karenia_brevis.AAC.1
MDTNVRQHLCHLLPGGSHKEDVVSKSEVGEEVVVCRANLNSHFSASPAGHDLAENIFKESIEKEGAQWIPLLRAAFDLECSACSVCLDVCGLRAPWLILSNAFLKSRAAIQSGCCHSRAFSCNIVV